MRASRQTWSGYFLLFMAVSFLGWATESVFFLFWYGRWHDRGFMTLPFCTIYGFSFLLLYGLIGAPGGDGALLGRGRRCSAPVYFLLSALIPTGLELITGYLFHRLFGVRLWSYSAYRFHFRGYICLEYSLLWGMLIPICMKYVFVPLKERLLALPPSLARPVSGALALLAALDWISNFARQELIAFSAAL